MVERPPLEKLLAIYYTTGVDAPVPSLLGRDPAASPSDVGGVPWLVALRCDVGAALAQLTEPERQAVRYYWSLYISREEHDGNAARARSRSLQALRDGNRGEFNRLRAVAKKEDDAASRIAAEMRRHTRRSDYTRALERLEVEIAARDIYARASMGDRVAFTGAGT